VNRPTSERIASSSAEIGKGYFWDIIQALYYAIQPRRWLKLAKYGDNYLR
jgi:hypothetical protein